MSLFKEGPSESQRTLASDVLETLSKSPNLTKDRGLKHLGQEASLNAYRRILENTGIPQEEVNSKVDETAERLRTHPRRETVVFIRTIHELTANDSRT